MTELKVAVDSRNKRLTEIPIMGSAKKPRLTERLINPLQESSHSPTRNRKTKIDKKPVNVPAAVPSTSTDSSTNSELVAGIIRSLYLENFMCHSRLEFHFNKNINFIVGKNGSGKSAIMAAVTLGLGGNASITRRGNSVKEVIQKGKGSCKISISLSNTGQFSYKRDIYGDTINITRVIRPGGSSAYSIKNAQGKEISKLKREVTAIVNTMNIQVENPICLLNQETAREFLSYTNPHEKYKLFMKVSLLDNIKNDYEEAVHHRSMVVEKLEDIEKDKVITERELGEWEKKKKLHENYDGLKEKKEQLRLEKEWALVNIVEEDLDRKTQSKENEERVCKKTEEKISQLEEKHVQLTEKDREYQKQVEALHESYSALKPKQEAAKSALELSKAVLQKTMRKTENIKDQLQSVDGNIKYTEREIEKAEENEQKVIEERRVHDEKLRNLQTQQEGFTATLQTRQHELNQLQAYYNNIQQQRNKYSGEIRDIKTNQAKLRYKLSSITSDSNDRSRMLGQWVPNVIRDIETAYRRGKFREKPVGPFGPHIKMKSEYSRYVNIVETSLKGLFKNFYVCCKEDMKVLREILLRYMQKEVLPEIKCGRFYNKVHDVSKHRMMHGEHPSVYDVIEVDNVMVMNALIDFRKIESILLLPNDDIAYSMMSDRRRVPRNCLYALTPSGYQYYPDPNYRSYSNPLKKAEFLQFSVEDSIREINGKISQLDNRLAEIAEEGRDTERNLNESKDELQKLTIEKDRVSKQLEVVKRQVRQMQMRGPPQLPSTDDMTNDLQELGTQKEELERQLSNLHQAMREHQEEVELKKQELKEIKTEIESLFSGLTQQNINLDHDKIKAEKCQCEKILERQKSTHKEKIKILNQLNEQIRQLQTKYQQVVETATEKGERPENIRKPEQVDHAIDQISQRLAKREELLESKEEILKEISTHKRHVTILHKQIKRLQDNKQMILSKIEARKATFEYRRNKYCTEVKKSFEQIILNNGYVGELNFDHNIREIKITASPPRCEIAKTYKRMKGTDSLSGGEKSFSSLAFILSLWKLFDCPFRMLDEFDVFMDMLNREFSVQLIVKRALHLKNNQFFILSPTDVPSMDTDQRISVHTMKPPRD